MCRYGVFAIQGNHDPDEFMDALVELGVKVLANETQQLEVKGGYLNLCGLRGHGRKTADIPTAVQGLDGESFSIAAIHYPEMAEAVAAAGVDLILAGHTHGGQICLPNGRAVITHSRTGLKYASGLERLGESYVYTCRGIGTTVVPLRIFCRPEIVRITLRRGEHSMNVVGRQRS